jgi:methylglutaconyl-CoA hydratase
MFSSVPGMGLQPPVRTATENGVTTVTLDSPGNRNALSSPVIEALLAAFAGAAADPGVRVVLLDHTGPAFCSGADLAETARAREAGTLPVARLGELLLSIWEHPKPVVARVAGPARAGGLGLIAAADIAVCDRTATFAFSEVRIGVIPAVISTVVLRRLDPRAAAELYLTGDTFTGDRAAQVGLVTAAVDAGELDATVRRYVDAVRCGAPGAVAGIKRLLRRVPEENLRAETAAMSELSTAYFRSAEAAEGMLAFREKRDPSWGGAPGVP